MTSPEIVTSNGQALEIARDFAHTANVNEAQAEAFAEVWFDAGKENAQSSPDSLRSHLASKFNRT